MAPMLLLPFELLLLSIKLTYSGGKRQISVRSITIPIVDDNIEEPEERFEVTLTPIRNVLIHNSTITIHIYDDSGKVTECPDYA